MNLPTQRTQNSLIRVKQTPITKNKLDSIIQFHLPIKAKLPENKAPIAAPAVVIDYTNITFKVISSSLQLLSLPYAAEAVFHDPIIYPKLMAPKLIVSKSDIK